MILSRTRLLWKLKLKEYLFDIGGMGQIVELRRRHQLEDSMGFRGQWESHRDFQIELLKSQGLLPSHRLLEIGCGPMTGGLPIIEYLDSGSYVGVDVRNSVLDLAWQEIGQVGLSRKNPRLICSHDFASPELSGDVFDFVFSFSVLFHLSDELLHRYLAAVSKRLRSEGKCIANVNTNVSDDVWLEFPFLKRTVDTYRQAAAEHGLSTVELGKISELGFGGQGSEKDNSLLVFTVHKG
ncbi:class I SAM-dependent methyltransferase [Bradyrhizobium sp. AZCC 1693]|uniref:class I SAM-dependent methyltransferase n=1 Tax=Bradyrhizobium sp. AZCC 1693 TaxID=3117029 RepID=UPI002FF30ACB